eukprot:TRINITY_DN44007_c0_g1_i1.p2 TRINITY_DN44007_c0_g1~~TRINITY_DN44007_c0_g1_i1.p2  ORF type:complete len:169 (+),score=59.79 TRINITY_DN44007_c0_g1_i1:122-628(+)
MCIRDRYQRRVRGLLRARAMVRIQLVLLLVAHVARSEMEHLDMPGGTFRMGTDTDGKDGEAPSRMTQVKRFHLDATPVTNSDFRGFIRATKYKTEAEEFGWSFVLDMLASTAMKDSPETQKLPDAEHWLAVVGAWWRQPEGPDSTIQGRENHPVVHGALKDARRYCAW